MYKNYHVRYIPTHRPEVLDANDAIWKSTFPLYLRYFHPQSTNHRPRAEARMFYNEFGIYLRFWVKDRYVRSLHTEYNSKVHEDSCVECFLQPPKDPGYYNFEINAGGTLHVNYIIDPRRDEKGKRRDMRSIPQELAATVEIQSSLPRIVDPEIKKRITWSLTVFIPKGFFALYTALPELSASQWKANFYKCADKTSHPHWAAWKAIKELNFHQPQCFGELIFDDEKGDK